MFGIFPGPEVYEDGRSSGPDPETFWLRSKATKVHSYGIRRSELNCEEQWWKWLNQSLVEVIWVQCDFNTSGVIKTVVHVDSWTTSAFIFSHLVVNLDMLLLQFIMSRVGRGPSRGQTKEAESSSVYETIPGISSSAKHFRALKTRPRDALQRRPNTHISFP